MISRYLRARTMSTRLPPQVELMREETVKTFSGSSKIRSFEAKPQTCIFLPNAKRSGATPTVWNPHIWPVRPMPVWTSSQMKRISFSSQRRRSSPRNSGRKWLSPPSAWIGSMMRAATSSRFSTKACFTWASGESLDPLHALDLGLVDGEAELRVHDSRPLELREVHRLPRVGGVRQGEGVAGPPVEGLLEVDDLVPDLAAVSLPEVLPHLPVEGGLQGVLDADGAPLDEVQVRGVARGDRDPRERLDEACHLRRVDVAVRGLRQRGPPELLEERGVLQLRVVVPDRDRREVREEVEDLDVVKAVVDDAPARAVEVHDDVVTVDEHVPAERVEDVSRVDLVGGDGRHGSSAARHHRDGAQARILLGAC